MESLKVNFAILFSLLFWASAFVGIRIGLADYSPGALALLRFLVASLCMVIMYVSQPKGRKMPMLTRFKLMLIGVAGIGVYNICLNIGELTVSAGVASFVIGMMPVCTIIMSVLFLRERPDFKVWLGIAVSFAGLILMVFGEKSPVALDGGVLIIFISVLTGSFFNISQKWYVGDYHPVIVTAWAMWGGTVMLLWFAPDLYREIYLASLEATLAAVYMGIFPAALAYIAWCYVIHHSSVSKSSMYLYFLPALSTLLGYLILREEPSGLSLAGGVLTLVGALIATRIFR